MTHRIRNANRYLALCSGRAKFFEFHGQAVAKGAFRTKFVFEQLFGFVKIFVATVGIVHQCAKHFLDRRFSKQCSLLVRGGDGRAGDV